LELNDQVRDDLFQIKYHLKNEGRRSWPITVKLIHEFHTKWQNLYGPLWSIKDTSNELQLTEQVIKDALVLMKYRAIYPDIIRVRNKKYALHLIRTYDTSPGLLMMKIAQEVQNNEGIPLRIKRNNGDFV